MKTEPRACQACSKTLHGRSDKKFCDDNCRSTYNNQLITSNNALVKRIDSTLKKNRRLLKQQIAEGEELGKCPRKKLQEAGFNFSYLTHQYANKKGNVYSFVYEYGYLLIDGDWVLVVKRSNQ